MMQFSAVRRTGKTYGKTNRSLIVHDLFDSRASPDHVSNPTTSRRLPTITREAQLQYQTKHTEPAEGYAMRSPSLQDSSSSKRVNQRGVATSEQINVVHSTMFDVSSSDEDEATDTSGSRASKRRRVCRLSNVRVPQYGQHEDTASTRPEPRLPKLTGSATRSDNPLVPPKKESTRTQSGEVNSLSSRSSTVKKQTRPANDRPRKVKRVPRITKTGGTESNRQLSENIKMAEAPLTDTPDEFLDQSCRAVKSSKQAVRRSSPRRTEPDFSSPGRLGLTALKIEATGLSPARMSPDLSSDGSSGRQKQRRRLIDRLDAPSTSEKSVSRERSPRVESIARNDDPQSTSQPRESIMYGQGRKKQALKASVQAAAPDGQQDMAATRVTKPRATYAAQRSYLSDMVDDLDGLNEPSSQKSVNELLLQPPVSSLASQLELEENESDDPATAGRVKSIHELRQAGANNRYDREVDALLEDIDTNDRSSKAVRLQALMKLVTKLQDPAFLRHMASSGRVQRLTSFASQPLDLPTSVLFVRALSLLSRSEDILIGTLSQIFKAASELATGMLADDRPLAKVAKDRKQNLSKAIINDLAEFANHNNEDIHSSVVGDPGLCSDAVALDCLEHTLHKMVQLGNTSARVSTSIFSQILRLLLSEAQHLQKHKHDPVTLTKLDTALSLLELCSVIVDDADLHVRDDEYEDLGNALAAIIFGSESLAASLERSVLRAVVSLSNNKPRMCRLFSSTAITKAAFDIIDKNFINLARQAEEEQTLHAGKLDSVVLALGCLLNFAECDPSLRLQLSRLLPSEGGYVAQLVSIFNSQVSKVDEAMTKEQSQISVAFGYLSMLLCALSLDTSIRSQITQLLKDKSFEELCVAAEKFFSHLRTLENISDDDVSMRSFTARFSAILETIRKSRV